MASIFVEAVRRAGSSGEGEWRTKEDGEETGVGGGRQESGERRRPDKK